VLQNKWFITGSYCWKSFCQHLEATELTQWHNYEHSSDEYIIKDATASNQSDALATGENDGNDDDKPLLPISKITEVIGHIEATLHWLETRGPLADGFSEFCKKKTL
jgi:hypothetical protein